MISAAPIPSDDGVTAPAPWIHPGAEVGAGCQLAPWSIVEDGAVVGDGCVLEPFARVCRGARLGGKVRLGQGSVVGGAPQHLAWNGDPVECVVGAGARIGEYATVHGGMSRPTSVGEGAFLMSYVHVGHDAVVGPSAIVANGVQLAGHVVVGEGANLGGGTLVHQGVRVGERAFVAGGLRLDRDVPPWSRVMGQPARWAGLNRIALEREGWTRERIAGAETSLRVLLRRGLRVDQALTVLADLKTREAAVLREFVQEGGRGIIRP